MHWEGGGVINYKTCFDETALRSFSVGEILIHLYTWKINFKGNISNMNRVRAVISYIVIVI